MKDTKKKSLWSRITGSGSDCGCCCGSVIEEVPEAEKEKVKKEETKKAQDKTETK